MARKRTFQSMTEMMEFFRKTGAAGGKKRASAMTKKQRQQSARKAANARWAIGLLVVSYPAFKMTKKGLGISQ